MVVLRIRALLRVRVLGLSNGRLNQIDGREGVFWRTFELRLGLVKLLPPCRLGVRHCLFSRCDGHVVLLGVDDRRALAHSLSGNESASRRSARSKFNHITSRISRDILRTRRDGVTR